MPGRRFQRYVSERDALLERIKRALEGDQRVIAAWLSGSFGRGEGDGWADYDLHLAIEDVALESFLKDRLSLYESLGEVVLVQDEIPGQSNVGARFHLVNFASPTGPIEVDWSYIPASEAKKPNWHVLLFERESIPVALDPPLSPEDTAASARQWALYFWAMAPIAVKYAARGETRRAATQVGLTSRALLCLWRLLSDHPGRNPWQPDANRPVEDELNRRLPQLGPEITPATVLDVINRQCDEVAALQTSLAAFGAAVLPAAIDQTRELIRTAQEEVNARRFPERKFR